LGEGVEEKGEVARGFLKCPFCSCFFCSRADLETHIDTFGDDKEQHEEAYRRTHGRAEYGSAE